MSEKSTITDNHFDLLPKEKELYQHVLELLKTKKTIRAFGSGHSKLYHSAIYDADAQSSSHMIDMRKYVEDPKLEHHAFKDEPNVSLLTVSAGTALKDIRKFLMPFGLKLYGTPESKTISIGGAVLCDAHNSTGYWDAMADYVVDMLIIDGTGQIHLITDPQLFVNYGLLGIVFRIRIKVFPATNIKWKHTLLKNINDLKVIDSTYCVFFGAYSGRILQTHIYLTKQKAYRSLKRIVWDLALWPLNSNFVSKFEGILKFLFPKIGIFATELFTYEPDAIRNKFDYFESIPSSSAYTLEYAIDINDLPGVYGKIIEVIAEYKQKKTYILRFWSRFQKATTNVNDLAFDRQTALVEITLDDKQKYALNMVNDISEILRQFNGKPHLGKTVLKPEDLKNYDFKKLKIAIKKYDPNYIFQNKFSKLVFK